MLIASISNINVAIKKNCLITFEKYNNQLIKLLKILWKKRLISGFTLKKNKIKIFLKYNKGVPVIKYFRLKSKPSRKLYKKKKHINYLSVLSNSEIGFCVLDNKTNNTLYGKLFFKIEY